MTEEIKFKAVKLTNKELTKFANIQRLLNEGDNPDYRVINRETYKLQEVKE